MATLTCLQFFLLCAAVFHLKERRPPLFIGLERAVNQKLAQALAELFQSNCLFTLQWQVQKLSEHWARNRSDWAYSAFDFVACYCSDKANESLHKVNINSPREDTLLHFSEEKKLLVFRAVKAVAKFAESRLAFLRNWHLAGALAESRIIMMFLVALTCLCKHQEMVYRAAFD